MYIVQMFFRFKFNFPNLLKTVSNFSAQFIFHFDGIPRM